MDPVHSLWQFSYLIKGSGSSYDEAIYAYDIGAPLTENFGLPYTEYSVEIWLNASMYTTQVRDLN